MSEDKTRVDMDSPQRTRGATVRLPNLSRRAVLGGASATPLVVRLTGNAGASACVTADPAVTLCQQWLAVEAERDRLMLLWGDIDGRLSKTHGWYRLSKAERRAMPAGRALDEIDARLDVLAEESDALLKALPSGPATSVAAIVANLTVAGRLLGPQDHPIVHNLIVRAARDIAALT